MAINNNKPHLLWTCLDDVQEAYVKQAASANNTSYSSILRIALTEYMQNHPTIPEHPTRDYPPKRFTQYTNRYVCLYLPSDHYNIMYSLAVNNNTDIYDYISLAITEWMDNGCDLTGFDPTRKRGDNRTTTVFTTNAQRDKLAAMSSASGHSVAAYMRQAIALYIDNHDLRNTVQIVPSDDPASRLSPQKSKLAVLRKKRGLSQTQLAKMLGVHKQTISQWERSICAPDAKHMAPLAAALECSVDNLIAIIADDHPCKSKLTLQRTARGLTQKQLAKMLGHSPSTVWKWENTLSTPDSDQLKAIATVLECSVVDLTEGD